MTTPEKPRHSPRASRIAPALNPSTARLASEDRDEAQRARQHPQQVWSTSQGKPYRHFDRNDRLLYIGISMTVTGRTAQHETYAPWFQEIATIKVDWYASRSTASRAEKLAIKTEQPLYNVIHNKDNKHAAKEPKARVVRSGTRKRVKRQPSL